MENKNKILFLCQYFYPEKVSSAVLPFELASYLSTESKYDVTALVGYPKEYSDVKKIPTSANVNGIHIKRVRYLQTERSNFLGRIINYLGLCISFTVHPFYFIKNDTYICYTNPPLLPLISAFFKTLFKKKMILVIYDLYPDVAIKLNVLKTDSTISKLFNKINTYVYKHTDKIVVLADEMKEYLIENKQIDSNQIEVIANWYQENDMSIKNEKRNNSLRVFYGGNMGMAQDMETIIKMMIRMKKYQEIEFHFAGHGVKKDELIKIKEKEFLQNCYIYDFLPKNEYDTLVLKSDLVIVSLEPNAWGLGSPSKVYGYLAAAKPIIAIMPENTDVVRDIKRFKNGFFIKNGDIDSFEKLLFEIMNNKFDLKQLGKRSLELFEKNYKLEICAKKYEELIKGG